MATGGASFEGCLPGRDYSVERRPYHRNCKCALHNRVQGVCPHASPKSTVSYPIRRSWSEGCLGLMVHATNSSPSSSPVVASAAGEASSRIPRQLPLYDHDP